MVIENAEMHLETLFKRRKKILKRVNVCQSVCEFYSFGEPPDYIFYIGESLGEAACMIPHRTGLWNKQVSREERWTEIRAMFKTNSIILDLMDIDPMAIKEH